MKEKSVCETTIDGPNDLILYSILCVYNKIYFESEIIFPRLIYIMVHTTYTHVLSLSSSSTTYSIYIFIP